MYGALLYDFNHHTSKNNTKNGTKKNTHTLEQLIGSLTKYSNGKWNPAEVYGSNQKIQQGSDPLVLVPQIQWLKHHLSSVKWHCQGIPHFQIVGYIIPLYTEYIYIFHEISPLYPTISKHTHFVSKYYVLILMQPFIQTPVPSLKNNW